MKVRELVETLRMRALLEGGGKRLSRFPKMFHDDSDDCE